MNQILDVINNRCSLRKYDTKEISKEDLDLIIEAAMRAPTAGNMMPYSMIVIRDEKMKEKLSHSCDEQPFIANASVLLVFVADFQKWYDYYRINDVKNFCLENNRTYETPTEANLFLAVEDTLVAAQNAVIAAESLNIGSCYIGDILEKYEEHHELLNLPKYAFPVAMLTLGYYPEDYNKTLRGRFDKKFVVFEDTYKKLSDDAIREMYSELDKRYSAENKVNAKNFAQLHYAYKVNSDFSKEMTRSIKKVLSIWNGLE